MQKNRWIAACAVAAALLLASGTAIPKTPDGETPAQEAACDGDPAFGLCNAYCESMDCDNASPHASDRACERVLASYVERTDGGVPACVAPAPADSAVYQAIHPEDGILKFHQVNFQFDCGHLEDSDWGQVGVDAEKLQKYSNG